LTAQHRVTALSPIISYRNARHIAEAADASGSTLKEAAPKSGFVSEEQFEKIVVSRNMIGNGLAGA
jgi:fumarate hydratase, class II